MKFLFSLNTLSHPFFFLLKMLLHCCVKKGHVKKKGEKGGRDITRFDHTSTSTNAPGSQVSFARTVTLKKLLLLSYMVTHNRLGHHNNKKRSVLKKDMQVGRER